METVFMAIEDAKVELERLRVITEQLTTFLEPYWTARTKTFERIAYLEAIIERTERYKKEQELKIPL